MLISFAIHLFNRFNNHVNCAISFCKEPNEQRCPNPMHMCPCTWNYRLIKKLGKIWTRLPGHQTIASCATLACFQQNPTDALCSHSLKFYLSFTITVNIHVTIFLENLKIVVTSHRFCMHCVLFIFLQTAKLCTQNHNTNLKSSKG